MKAIQIMGGKKNTRNSSILDFIFVDVISLAQLQNSFRILQFYNFWVQAMRIDVSKK